MKKLLKNLILITLILPSFTFAQTPESVSITVSAETDFSEYKECNGDLFCQQVREEIIKTLKDLIAELLERVQELQEEKKSTQDLSETKDSTYAIKTDGSLAGATINEVPQVGLEIWEDYKLVSPEEYTQKYLSFLRVYYDDEDAYAAYVEQDSNNRDKWILGINLYNSNNTTIRNRKDLVETLIHEFAHVLTLAEDQVDNGVRESRCGTFYLAEGCLFKNSYLNGFIEEFWDTKDFRNSEDIEDEEDDFDAQEDIAQDHYDKYRDEFVSAYATTNPAEDMAESFAKYVLKDKPTSDKDEKDEKLLYFFDFPELVKMRNDIRDNFKTLFNF